MSAELVRAPAGAAAPLTSSSGSGAEAPAPGPLDHHEGIDDPRGLGGCRRWPEHLRLRNVETGELVYGRCRATNLCRYCQRLYVLETVEMLLLDAMEWAPSVWVVLTAREHLTRDQCRRHLRQLLLAGRRRWPELQWFVQVEFQRRGALHVNLLVKGVPAAAVGQLRELLGRRWCDRVDAEMVGQWAGSIDEAGGVVRYLAKHLAHGLKVEQAPPIGWRGHRTSQTGGYLVRPASVMREEARASRRLRRALRRQIEAGAEAHDAELLARAELAQLEAQTWELWQQPGVSTGNAEGRSIPAPRPSPAQLLEAEAVRLLRQTPRGDADRLGASSSPSSTEAGPAAGDERSAPALPGLEDGRAQAPGAATRQLSSRDSANKVGSPLEAGEVEPRPPSSELGEGLARAGPLYPHGPGR